MKTCNSPIFFLLIMKIYACRVQKKLYLEKRYNQLLRKSCQLFIFLLNILPKDVSDSSVTYQTTLSMSRTVLLYFTVINTGVRIG